MPARKTPSNSPQDGHAFAVVVEEIRGQFRVFGEALAGLREEMSRRFDEVDRRFHQVDRRFDDVDRRFDRVEGDIGLLKTDVGLLKTAVVEHSRQLKGIRAKLDGR
jgi:hypothetical protein